MHFAVLVVTKDKPTKDVLAGALAPWRPQAGDNARWDWHALGGRYRGMLNATYTTKFLVGEPEYPDDEPGLQLWHDPRGGVDALRRRDWHSFAIYVPRVVVFHDERAGCWWERFYEIVRSVPDDHWMSIVDCRAPRGSAVGQVPSNGDHEGHAGNRSGGGLVGQHG